eukprot:SAG31_NODE_2026_length_6641_cov_3.312290_4_plen_83_part_00
MKSLLAVASGICVHQDQWDVQATIKRLNGSLIARGYVTWFDLTNMKGARLSVQSVVLGHSLSCSLPIAHCSLLMHAGFRKYG